MGIDYEYLCWDREVGDSEYCTSHVVTSFDKVSPSTNWLFKKVYDYWLFSRFTKKIIENSNYDYVIVHTIVCALFLKIFLINKYKNRYIFDIRDYSPAVPFFKKWLSLLIKNSLFTTISSLGFLVWLPDDHNYIVSHNIEKSLLEPFSIKPKRLSVEHLNLLTIGQIRDLSANQHVIESFANKGNVTMIFAGFGPAINALKKFSAENFVKNISFTGKYKKIDEMSIVQSSDILNILLPINTSSNALITNRFYLSLASRTPMIVNSESIHAKFVKEFYLGVIVELDDDLYEKLLEYCTNFDEVVFRNGCQKLTDSILQDIFKFEQILQRKLT